jgi:hypothetical protein
MDWISNGGWKSLCAIAYIAICMFDFVIIPAWIGIMRESIDVVMAAMPAGDVSVQLEYLKLLTGGHDPLTMRHGGLFHLAFGAILTGSALNKRDIQ